MGSKMDYRMEQMELDLKLPRSPRCVRCGRPLSNPKSMEAGIGPICARKARLEAAMERYKQMSDVHLDEPPFGEAIVIKRLPGEGAVCATNVPHLVVHHSPSGFEFGYAGSGPADLALNIAEAVLMRMSLEEEPGGGLVRDVDMWDGSKCSYEAWIIHQDLKFLLIAPMDQDGAYVIPYSEAYKKVRGLLAKHADRIEEHRSEVSPGALL